MPGKPISVPEPVSEVEPDLLDPTRLLLFLEQQLQQVQGGVLPAPGWPIVCEGLWVLAQIEDEAGGEDTEARQKLAELKRTLGPRPAVPTPWLPDEATLAATLSSLEAQLGQFEQQLHSAPPAALQLLHHSTALWGAPTVDAADTADAAPCPAGPTTPSPGP